MKLAALIVESLIWIAYCLAGYAALWIFGHTELPLAVLATAALAGAAYWLTRPLQWIADNLTSRPHL